MLDVLLGTSTARPKIDRSRRPDVGIVFSESTSHSNESKNLANYLCGHLATAGFSNLYMIGIDAQTGGPAMTLAQAKRILYCPHGGNVGDKKQHIEIPASDLTYAYLDRIQTCHIVIVTVNSNDMSPLKRQLVDMLTPQRQGAPKSTTIFSIQRGVRNAQTIKDAFHGRKDIAVIECVVGFAVVPHPKSGAYCPTTQTPSIIFERLSKEIEDIADGPLRTMENIDVAAFFDKTLTPYSWGVMIWENLYALNIITGGTLRDTLSQRDARLILAVMARECRRTLKTAARGGEWRPLFKLVSTILSPWSLEMLLALPLPFGGDFFSHILFLLLGLLPPDGIISPGQLDMAESRKTMSDMHLGELVATGRRHGHDMPACQAVLAHILKMEEAVKQYQPGSGCGGPGEMAILRAAIAEKSGESRLATASMKENAFWMLRFIAVASFLPLLYYLFISEH